MKDYHINIFFSDDENAYVADIPDLEDCSAVAPTPEEALRQVLLAKQMWLDVALSEGRAIPPPKYKPKA
jgi:predicted RNase H-like HicB family nuclease